jgi:hypothetical protein
VKERLKEAFLDVDAAFLASIGDEEVSAYQIAFFFNVCFFNVLRCRGASGTRRSTHTRLLFFFNVFFFMSFFYV